LAVRNKKLAIQQKENDLTTAQQNLNDYSIKAPFAGLISVVNVSKGDEVSGSTVIAQLITQQKIAEITLNEIDTASVKVGQKATLAFDAVKDLSITGEVVEIDTIGTVNQGVVSFTIKIAFDVQDERVKPGMSVSANIITQSKADVWQVPLNAIKTQGDSSYVEVLVNNQPQQKTVTTGISNDSMIEIINGLTENDEVITQTIHNNKNSSTQGQQRPPEAMGGMMRIMR
jgi:HlyD family secretion protein